MAFDWKAFGAAFLEGQTQAMQERKSEAKDYEERQRQLAEQNNVLRAQREARARQAAQLGRNAIALMDPGIPQAQREAMVANAMATGPAGIQDFYNQLQAASSQRGMGNTLSMNDIQAVVQVPANLPPVNMSLVDYAMQTYGARLPEGAAATPTTTDRSVVAKLFGFGAREAAEKRLAEDVSYGGMSIREINQLASLSDYSSMYDDAWMTFSERPFITPEVSLDFATTFNKTLSDYKTSDEAEQYARDLRMKFLEDNPDASINEQNTYVSTRLDAWALYKAQPIVLSMLDTYGPSVFDNRIMSDVIRNSYGLDEFNSLRESVGLESVGLAAEEDQPPSGEGEPLGEDITPEKTDSALLDENAAVPEDDEFKPATPLSEEGKTIVEDALKGFAIFRDAEGKYTDLYTREQWDSMTRKQRRERGLPETAIGGLNFYFRDDIEEYVREPMANLNIVNNPVDAEYRVTIKGRVGAYNVTKDQLALIPEQYLTGASPTVTIRPYEEGEDRGRSIGDSRLTSILR
jgi:hypothetical protein